MDLNDLLADVDGIGQYTDAPVRLAEQAPEPPQPSPTPTASLPPVASQRLPWPQSTHAPALGSLEMVLDLDLELLVDLGQTRLPLKQFMQLQPGDELSLNQRPEDPLPIYIGEQLVGYGEALIVDGMRAVKIVKLLFPEQGEAGGC